MPARQLGILFYDADMKDPYAILRWAGLVEGLSYLLLLFVAVPVKYLAGNEMLVKIVGPIHGGLFLAFYALAFYCWNHGNWSAKPTIKVLASAWIPFGWLWIESFLKRESAELK